MLPTVHTTILVENLRQPDNDDAWRQFCARYEPMLIAFAHRAGLAEEDARDVVQETLLTFVESFRAGEYDRERGQLRSWLQGIAFNRMRRLWGQRSRREAQVLDQTGVTSFFHRVPDNAELVDIFDAEWRRAIADECLRQVRQAVDPTTYAAFELYALHEWPAEKVAKHLNITRNTVYISKTRVLSRLRDLREQITEIW